MFKNKLKPKVLKGPGPAKGGEKKTLKDFTKIVLKEYKKAKASVAAPKPTKMVTAPRAGAAAAPRVVTPHKLDPNKNSFVKAAQVYVKPIPIPAAHPMPMPQEHPMQIPADLAMPMPMPMPTPMPMPMPTPMQTPMPMPAQMPMPMPMPTAMQMPMQMTMTMTPKRATTVPPAHPMPIPPDHPTPTVFVMPQNKNLPIKKMEYLPAAAQTMKQTMPPATSPTTLPAMPDYATTFPKMPPAAPEMVPTGQEMGTATTETGGQALDPTNIAASNKFNFDPNQNNCPENQSKKFLYIVTVLSAISGFLFGYDTGVISGAMIYIRDYFVLDAFWQELIVSATVFSALLSSFFAGSLSDSLGRKLVIVGSSIIFTISGILMAFAPDKIVLLFGRFVAGIGIGLTSTVIPIYIAEVSPPYARGSMVTFNSACIPLGQFVASIFAGLFSIDQQNGWRWMLGFAVVPSLLQMFFFIRMPSSPRWLIQKGRYKEAYESLAVCRSALPGMPQIQAEFNMIKVNAEMHQNENDRTYTEIFNCDPVRKALTLGCLMMMYQQLAGINSIMYYSATIIQMSGVGNKQTAVWLTALTSFINTGGSFIGMAFVEKCGRRKLYLCSMMAVILALCLLGISFFYAYVDSPDVNFYAEPDNKYCNSLLRCLDCVDSGKCGYCFYELPGGSPMFGKVRVNGTCIGIGDNAYQPPMNGSQSTYGNGSMSANQSTQVCRPGDTDWFLTREWCPSNYTWLIIIGLCTYLIVFAPGMGAISWTVTSEIYPLWARSKCTAVSTSVNWLFNLIVSVSFLSLSRSMTPHGVFFLYAGITMTGFLLLYHVLPETRGKTLEEIEQLFNNPFFGLGELKGKENELQNATKFDFNGFPTLDLSLMPPGPFAGKDSPLLDSKTMAKNKMEPFMTMDFGAGSSNSTSKTPCPRTAVLNPLLTDILGSIPASVPKTASEKCPKKTQ